MIQALWYTDEKSDKFWRIETRGCELAVNWGKAKTAGRYEIKAFDTEDECEKQALKLTASKLKKGYQIMEDFDSIQHFYYDTDEYGPHSLTSHPIFRKFFADELYYDCSDEEAPFGSDEGSDTLHELQEVIRKRPKMNFAEFPRFIIEKQWGLAYIPPKEGQTDDELREQAGQTFHSLPGDQEILQTDQVILATALGQIKITGKLDVNLQQLAFLSLNRMERMYRLLWNWNQAKPPYSIEIMYRDFRRFAKHADSKEIN